jgi:AraC-like DNA-binding protein
MKTSDYTPTDFLDIQPREELLLKTIHIIEAYISDPDLNGNILSKELGISKRVLYERLRNLAGQTVNEFIRTVRLKKSIDYLIEGKFNITQISIEMGFNSASYFTRSFKKYFGISPRAYREIRAVKGFK